MKGESNQKRSNGTGRDIKISNSRAMGVIVLIALLFVFQVVTFVWHKVQDGPLADGDAAESAVGAGAGGTSAGGTGAVRNGTASGVAVGGRFARGERFRFDPNTISADSLQLLGFSAKQAQSILKYRAKGGKFRYREDFSRLYVVDSAVYVALEEYIALPHRSSGTKGAGGVPGAVQNGVVGTKGVQDVPGGAVVGTKEGISVPDAVQNGVAGTKGASGVPGGAVAGTKEGISVPDAVQNGVAGTKGEQDVPGGAVVGTKEGISVPDAVQNGVAGTKGAQNVPNGAAAGTNIGVFVPDGGKNAVLGNTDPSGSSNGSTDLRRSGPGNTDPSGSIYGRKVERNRYMCNLNTADSAALVQLYGIGGYYARKILRYREVLGGSFVDARQLLEIEGFTQERFARIEKNVFVSEEDVKGFSILNAKRKALERHPYIGPYAARGIVTYLKLKGKESFENEMHLLEQLVKEKIIGEGNAQKLREYLLHL